MCSLEILNRKMVDFVSSENSGIDDGFVQAECNVFYSPFNEIVGCRWLMASFHKLVILWHLILAIRYYATSKFLIGYSLIFGSRTLDYLVLIALMHLILDTRNWKANNFR